MIGWMFKNGCFMDSNGMVTDGSVDWEVDGYFN